MDTHDDIAFVFFRQALMDGNYTRQRFAARDKRIHSSNRPWIAFAYLPARIYPVLPKFASWLNVRAVNSRTMKDNLK